MHPSFPSFFCVCIPPKGLGVYLQAFFFWNRQVPDFGPSTQAKADIPEHIMVMGKPVVPGYYRSHVTVCKISHCSEILVLSRLIKP